ncbi:MAG: SMP-30/gluconolactonase/LRE family protein [Proteobacteria bacterium]|nr:SMP-30/gluconolactonase/LRE family protein [Pseudomonadota bacterium]
MNDFKVEVDSLKFVGEGLNRPECVLCTANGAIYTADWRGGVCQILPDGRQSWILANDCSFDFKPNGIALEETGHFLIANLGADGGLYRLSRQGELEVVADVIDGKKIPPANFVMKDRYDRIWLTVSTWLRPRSRGYRRDVADGFIALIENKEIKIVADNLGYTNEVKIDPSGNWLYVIETFGRKLSRFALNKSGVLGKKEVVTEFGEGIFPDGLAFDCEGGIWITSIISNRLLRIAPGGKHQLILEDLDHDHVNSAEQAFKAGVLDREHLDTIRSKKLKNVSSLAFGGKDLKTIYLGCLLGDSLATFSSPVAGVPPLHWNYC